MHLSYNNDEICRVCLSTANKLYPLSEHGLSQKLAEVTGLQVSADDRLPQQLCVFCIERLKKSLHFINTSKCTNQLLVSNLRLGTKLTTSALKSLNISGLAFPFETTKALLLSCSDNEINTAPKDQKVKLHIDEGQLEIKVSYDNTLETSLDNVEEENRNKDCTQNYFDSVIETQSYDEKPLTSFEDRKEEDPTSVIESVDDMPEMFDIRKETTPERDLKIEMFSLVYLNDHNQGSQRVLHEYIFDKYLKNGNEMQQNIISNRERKKQKMAHRKIFHDYIANKYNTTHQFTIQPQINVPSEDLKAFCTKYSVEIQILDKEQQKQDVLKRKERDSYKQAVYKCDLCYQGFVYIETYQNHMACHDPNKPYGCHACFKTFANRQHLRSHSYLHARKYICKLCGNISKNSSAAREHYKEHTGQVYPCPYCDQVFLKLKKRCATPCASTNKVPKYRSRVNHISSKHGEAKCDICSQEYNSQKGLIMHMTLAHRDMIKCETCAVLFHDQDALRVHIESLGDTVCGTHIMPCPQCGLTFTNNGSLEEHVEFHHNTYVERRDGYVRRRCKAKLLTNPEPRETIQPKPKRTNIYKPMCETCGYQARNGTVLGNHQRIHTGEKPFSCAHCDKKFRLKLSLKNHIRTHTGDRPYQCRVCHKGFAIASNLLRHQHVHTEVRSHPCEVCNKMFKSVAEAKNHLKAVHMKLPGYSKVRNRKRSRKES